MERRSTRQLHANTTEAVNGVKVIELLQTLKELYMTMYNVEHNRLRAFAESGLIDGLAVRPMNARRLTRI